MSPTTSTITPLTTESNQHVWHAKLDLAFTKTVQDKTILSKNRHEGPLLVQKTLYPEGDAICHAVILHPPAGIAGGDHLKIDVALAEETHAVIATPGATKWYKSNGKAASQTLRLQLAAQSTLDFLPQENIFFDQVSASNHLEVHQAVGSSLLAWEMHQLGRTASGENWQEACIALSTEWHFDEALVWTEAAQLTADSPLRTQTYGLDGLANFATLWMCSPNASRAWAEELASQLPWHATLRASVTHFELAHGQGLIVLRGLAQEMEDIKQLWCKVWLQSREQMSNLAPQPLRLWTT